MTFVETPAWTEASAGARSGVEENLRFAEDLGAEVIRVAGRNVARALAQTARDHNAGTLVIGHIRQSRLRELVAGSLVRDLMSELGDVDLRVVSLDGARRELAQPAPDSGTNG